MRRQHRLRLAAAGRWLLHCEEGRVQPIGRQEQLQSGRLVRFDDIRWLTCKRSRGVENLHSSFHGAREKSKWQNQRVGESAGAGLAIQVRV